MILCSGCFDGLHAGHVAYLRGAAALADPKETLIVAIASDEYVQLHKRRAPMWSAADRSETVRAVRFVSDTVTHNSDGAAHIIRWLKPRVFVKGDDWRLLGLPDDVVAACHDTDCMMVFVNSGGYKHTSDALSTDQ